MSVRATILACLMAGPAFAAGHASLDPRFEPLVPLARQCLSGPVPEAACVGLIENRCRDGEQTSGDTRLVCAQAAAQVWQRTAHDTVAALTDRLGADSDALPILVAYMADLETWRAETCDIERRLANRADIEAQVAAVCIARIARMQALRLHRLAEELP